MDYATREIPSGIEIALTGKLTMRDHDQFGGLVGRIGSAPGSLCVLDLAGLDFIDSAGLGMFLLVQDTARETRKRIVLRQPKPQVRRLLEVACFHTLFPIEE
ncbi:MAG TPA: STAS domain-containing protein [Azospirillaceae bacterium]|nr:STAS domain-containing protein [Azospirillaceae bacterium]